MNMLEDIIAVRKGQPQVIRPRVETPNEVLYLTQLDLLHSMHVSTLCVYESNNDVGEGKKNPAKVLKDALENVLVFYYPLAGRLKVAEEDHKRLEVVCNSKGAVFAESEANCTLEEVCFLKEPYNPTTRESSLFVEVDFTLPVHEIPLLLVQVTTFKCGGFVIGVRSSHRMLDGQGFSQFMNDYAEMARVNTLSTVPVWERDRLAPRQPPRFNVNDFVEVAEKMAFQKPTCHALFNIPHGFIESLKFDIVQESQGSLSYCSSFEALVALIWKITADSQGSANGFYFYLNARKALGNLVPKGYYGNCSLSMEVNIDNEDKRIPKKSDVIRMVRQVKEKLDLEYVRSYIDFENQRHKEEQLVCEKMFFNDWSKAAWLPDFGIGKGFRVGVPYDAVSPMPPCAFILPEGNNANYLEVLVGLPQESFLVFKAYMEETLAYFSYLRPSKL